MSQFVSAVAGAPSDLTDAERAALLQLAIHNAAALDGITLKAAADLLDRAAEQGHAHLVGDAEHVTVTIHGRALVAISRADLAALLIEDLDLDAVEAPPPEAVEVFNDVMRRHGLDPVCRAFASVR
jgi:hypothetical protein